MAQHSKTILFNNGYTMPIIGFGTAGDKSLIESSLNAALEAGYRHIDTAPLYGTEKAVGEVLKEWFSSGKLKREDVFITSKLMNIANHEDRVEKHLKQSLEALQLSYVDLFIIHPVGFRESDEYFPKDKDGNVLVDPTTDIIKIWKAVEKQVDAGRIKSIGLSNFNSKQIKRIMKAARIRPTNLQIELNVYFQQKELVAFCKALDITVCAYAPLGSNRFKELTKMSDISSPLDDPVIEKIAIKHHKSPAHVLLRHCIQRGVAAIPSSSNPARIKENYQVFDFELDEDDMYEIYLLDKGKRARMYSAKILKGFDKHPEYPFNDPY